MKFLAFLLALITCLSNIYASGDEENGKKEGWAPLPKLFCGKADVSGASLIYMIGGTFGISTNTVVGSSDISYQTGIYAAVSASRRIGRRFWLTKELAFAQKGESQKFNQYVFSQTTNYLQLAVLPTYIAGRNVKVHGYAGPTFGWWMSGRQSIKDTQTGEKEKFKYEFQNDEFYKDNRLELGVMAGLGLSFRLFCGWMNAGLRANYGFCPIGKYPDSSFQGDKLRNFGLAAAFSYTIPIYRSAE